MIATVRPQKELLEILVVVWCRCGDLKTSDEQLPGGIYSYYDSECDQYKVSVLGPPECSWRQTTGEPNQHHPLIASRIDTPLNELPNENKVLLWPSHSFLPLGRS